jgi:hypothetical protein
MTKKFESKNSKINQIMFKNKLMMRPTPIIKISPPKQQFHKYYSPENKFDKIPLILNLINDMNDYRKTMKNQKYKLRFSKLNKINDPQVNSKKNANIYKNNINNFNKDCSKKSPEVSKILPKNIIISLPNQNSETSLETHNSLIVSNNNFNIAKLPKKNIEQNYNCNININMEKNIIMDKWEDNNPENQKETVIFSNDINEGESEMSIKTIDILTNTYSDITSKSSSSFINYKLGQESKEEISSISSLK